jgi:ferredoxin-nitrate reductase
LRQKREVNDARLSDGRNARGERDTADELRPSGERHTRSLCPYCGVGCGLIVRTRDERVAEVAGDPLYPVNRGRTCRKPLELGSAVHAPDRATTPLLRGRRDARFEEVGWVQALQFVAARLRELDPHEIGFHVSGQLLTEDYYAFSKLARGFLGVNNLDSNSRLCMSSAVAGYTGAFGADGPPPAYADLALTDCLLLLGTNTASCHPIVWARIRDRQAEGAFVICADPRPTPTAQLADLHLPVRPGTDLALLNALLCAIEREGLIDEAFVKARTSGFQAALQTAREWPPERAAEVCGVRGADIERAAERFGKAGTAMALWSMGANQSTVGTLKNRALINLCLATGNLGRPGAGPLSLTGQPNAMGGREVGGLAHLLPGYRRIERAEDRAAIEAHWECPPIDPTPGLPAVEMFDAAADGHVRALWVVATNPAVSMPDSGRARAALERAELVVVQDAHHPTETSALAHVVLPAAAWPEKEGAMTNSERRIGLVRRSLSPPGQALPDWRIAARAAATMGFGDAFAWQNEAEVFAEFAACTAGRPCDVSGVTHERLRRLGSVQWPCPSPDHGGTVRLYERGYPPHTPDGRAAFAPTPHRPTAEEPDSSYPLLLTTGRIADQWHTMSRTGKSPRLRAAAGPGPFVEMHPSDAAEAGLSDGEEAELVSRRGRVRARVAIDERLPRGVAFAPFHWGDLHAPAGAGMLNATTHRAVDPTSRQPELKALAIRALPVRRRSSPAWVERPEAPPTGRRRAHARPAGAAPSPARSVGASRHMPYPTGAIPRRLVIVGSGMAGLAVAEEVRRRRDPDQWTITILGEEAQPTYNRILLSKLLARTCGEAELELHPLPWYVSQGIELVSGCAASSLDLSGGEAIDQMGRAHPYDALVLATGSRPFVPPIPGSDLPHVFAFRTLPDVAAIAQGCEGAREAVVVGGGLLGLEAAAGLLARGVRTSVVELAPQLMAAQLDAGAAAALARSLGALGLRIFTGCSVAGIQADRVEMEGSREDRDGSREERHRELPADLVVIAAGVRPEIALARAAGLECARGISVDDAMRTSSPGVLAVGECAEHRGTVYGLWSPLAEQARVAAATLVGDPAGFHGAVTATTLKVAGVDVFAGGTPLAEEADDELVVSDTRRGVYRRLILQGDTLRGAQLVGDVTQARKLSELLRSAERVPTALLEPAAAAAETLDEDPNGVVCSCNGVTRGAIAGAIARGGLRTVAQVGTATRAGTGCGSCAGELQAMLRSSSDGNTTETAAKRPAATIPA